MLEFSVSLIEFVLNKKKILPIYINNNENEKNVNIQTDRLQQKRQLRIRMINHKRPIGKNKFSFIRDPILILLCGSQTQRLFKDIYGFLRVQRSLWSRRRKAFICCVRHRIKFQVIKINDFVFLFLGCR